MHSNGHAKHFREWIQPQYDQYDLPQRNRLRIPQGRRGKRGRRLEDHASLLEERPELSGLEVMGGR
jgi:hypothetical protein